MFNASRIRRSAVLGALACALLAVTTGDVAAAQTDDDALLRAVRAQQCYYESCPEEKSTRTRPDSPPITAAQAQAQERYYSTYGEPEPIAAPVAPAPDNGTPWLTIALAAIVALAAASIAVISRRRLRLRRRVARATT